MFCHCKSLLFTPGGSRLPPGYSIAAVRYHLSWFHSSIDGFESDQYLGQRGLPEHTADVTDSFPVWTRREQIELDGQKYEVRTIGIG